MKTAGMVQGTPDWQLDRMYETETAEMLERAYSHDDFPLSDIKDEFGIAKYYLGLAVDHLIRASKTAEHYGKEKPIDELIEKLDDDIPFKMSRILDRYKEGA